MISHTLSKTEFLQFQSAFKARANAGKLSREDMLLYNIVRGKDPRRGFTAITNTAKLANGSSEWSGWQQARYFLQYRFMGPKRREFIKELYTIELTDEQFTAFQNIIKDL